MPLYFAYGSNMNVDAMGSPLPPLKAARARPARAASIGGDARGLADRDFGNPSSAVHGVLWDLALSDIAALDRHESLSQGLYTKETQPVIAERGPKRAIVDFGALMPGLASCVRLTLRRFWQRRGLGRFQRTVLGRWRD